MVEYHTHTPVLLESSVDALVTTTSGIYIDGTLGGGGHSAAILDRLAPDALLFGVDQDDEALQAASERIGDDNRFLAVKGNFGYLKTIIPPEYHGKVSGILLDLGVSTHQIKEGERGFSFQNDGPLDMRMGTLTGVTAHDVVNHYDYERLRDLIFLYGEEKASRQIAKAIIEARPVATTNELSAIIRELVPERFATKSLARVFQAIRIEVNRELDMLKAVLEQSLDLLSDGGRLVVISYHSLEDRLVKRFFKTGNFEGKTEKDFYGTVIAPLSPVNRQVIIPSDQEISSNPASRSAKLRIAERIKGGDA